MGKLTQVWLSDDGVAFHTEAEMLAHEEKHMGEKLAKNYETFLDHQVSGYEYEIHSENLSYISTEAIVLVIEHLKRQIDSRKEADRK